MNKMFRFFAELAPGNTVGILLFSVIFIIWKKIIHSPRAFFHVYLPIARILAKLRDFRFENFCPKIYSKIAQECELEWWNFLKPLLFDQILGSFLKKKSIFLHWQKVASLLNKAWRRIFFFEKNENFKLDEKKQYCCRTHIKGNFSRNALVTKMKGGKYLGGSWTSCSKIQSNA